MRYTKGSILQFTADSGWIVEFKVDAESWVEPVLGWAVEVAFTSYDPDSPEALGDDSGDIETHLEPVILEERRYPVLLHDYLTDRSSGGKKPPSFTIRRAT